MKRLVSLLFFALCFCAAPFARAQFNVPAVMSFQGRLATPSGNPIPDNPNQTLTFRLYSALTGGTKLWEQVSTNLAVKNGTFAVKFNFSIGFQGGATLSSVFNGNPVYLEIKVGNDTALTPRQQLTSSAYAFLANGVPDGSITLNNLAGNVLNFGNIGGTIVNSQIGNGVVTNNNIAAGTITGDRIANNTITSNNLVSSLQAQFGSFNSNPFAVVGSVATTQPTKVVISNGYAYVSSYGYNYINVYNLSARTTPLLVATISCFRANGLAISGNILYVACTDGNLRLYDISNPNAPITKGSISQAGSYFSVAVSGNYAFVTNYSTSTLQVFNVSNANAPTLAAGIGTDANPIDVALSGNYAYVACSGANTLAIFNISNPSGPSFVSRVTTGSTPYDIAIDGNIAYIVNLNGQTLQKIDASVPTAPVVMATTHFGFEPISVLISGSNLYVGGMSRSLVQFSLINGLSAPTNTTNALGGDVDGLALDGGYLYAAVSAPNVGALEVISISVGLSTFTFTVTDVLTATNITGLAGVVNLRGQLNLDPNGVSAGGLSNGLVFGAAVSGEGLSSKRSSGSNQNGLDFYTNFTPRLSVTNGGSVGIGTTTPASTLEVAGDIRLTVAGKPYVLSYDSAGGYFFIDEFGAARRFVIKNGGNVGIGTTTPSYLLDVNGSLRCFGFTNSSDVRFKKNIADLADPLDSLLGLRGVSYEWRKGEFKETQFADGRQFGFIAQEVEKIFPDLVSTDAKGYKSVNYLGVIPVAVEAIKTLKAKNDALESKLDAVLKRLNALESHSNR